MTENVANLEARANPIWLMTANTENLKVRDEIKIKSFETHKTRIVRLIFERLQFVQIK